VYTAREDFQFGVWRLITYRHLSSAQIYYLVPKTSLEFLKVKNSTRCNRVTKILLSIILNEAQHVSGDTPPIIRSLKLHKQTLVLHTWKVVERAVVGRCQAAYMLARPRTQHDCHHDTKVKPEAATAVIELLMMGEKRPETC